LGAETLALCSLEAEASRVVLAGEQVRVRLDSSRRAGNGLPGAMAITLLQGSPALPATPAPRLAGEGLCTLSEAHARERRARYAIASPPYRLTSRDVVLSQPFGQFVEVLEHENSSFV